MTHYRFSCAGLGLIVMPLFAGAEVPMSETERRLMTESAPRYLAGVSSPQTHLYGLSPAAEPHSMVLAKTSRMQKGAGKRIEQEEPDTSATDRKEVRILDLKVLLKMEGLNLRNTNLRQGEKRENETELEPLIRLNAYVMKNNPVYGFIEMELKEKTKRETGKQTDKEVKLELNQIYIGLTDDIIPDTKMRIGRWLYRDEREWLFDENIDGVLAQWKKKKWRIDALWGRVNHWQRDLLDSKTKSTTPVNTGGLIVRRKMGDEWLVGAYGVYQRDISTDSDRQLNVGLRSHNTPKKGLRHWAEVGMVDGKESGKTVRGYAVDVGATWQFDDSSLKPRLTLGYAYGSGDGQESDSRIKGYRQTGLHSNEATFGGETKFKIYGETFNPDLTNMHILTAGAGINITPKATLDLVYHYYRQDQLAELARKSTELSPKYDHKTSKSLGEGLDLVFGYEHNDNIKFETAVGMFNPSDRFFSGSDTDSERSANAYSAWFEVEVSF